MLGAMPDWAFTVLAWGLGLGALAGLGMALFGDLARGRRRCSKCWYDMRGVATTTCPECGKAHAHEKALLKTRRRWRWAVGAALLVAVAWQVGEQPRRKGEGWTSWVPTTVLVFITPVDDALLYSEKSRALHSRLGRHSTTTLWSWQRWLLAWRESLNVSDAQIVRMTLLREKWPLGVAPVVRANAGFLVRPFFLERRLTAASPDVSDRRIDVSASQSGWQMTTPYTKQSEVLELPAPERLGEQTHALVTELHIGPVVRRLESTLRYEVVATIEEVLRPVSSPEIESMVRAAIMPQVYADAGVRMYVLLALPLDSEEVLWVYRIDWILDGRTVATTTPHDEVYLCVPGRPGPAASREREIPALTGPNDSVSPGLTIRLRCDPVETLRQSPQATTFWTGSLEARVVDLLK